MSKNILSYKEIQLISKNKYVKSVSEKGITVTREVTRTFTYYNNYRYKWVIKKMTPME